MANTFHDSELTPLFLTLPKAARRMGVSPPMARDMARSGSLPIVQVGKRKMVVASLLNDPAWLMNHGNPAGASIEAARA